MELVVASRNRKKAVEIRNILAGLPIIVSSLDEFPEVTDVEEDGETFVENAVKKALHAARGTGLLALADDSGLEVEILDGAPGVRSARYSGEDADDQRNNARLLEALEGVEGEGRRACFRCVIALADPGGSVETAEGVCEGLIGSEPRGSGGFGYDPLFFYPPLGKTFGELAPEEKHKVSHRGKALREAAKIIRERIERR